MFDWVLARLQDLEIMKLGISKQTLKSATSPDFHHSNSNNHK